MFRLYGLRMIGGVISLGLLITCLLHNSSLTVFWFDRVSTITEQTSVSRFFHEDPAVIQEKVTSFRANGYQLERLNPYDAHGDYMDFGRFYKPPSTSGIRFDDDGLIMVQYSDGNYYYNPVTISQLALTNYGLVLTRNNQEIAREKLIKSADKLLALQDKLGAFRYSFKYEHYHNDRPLEPGWVSSMAQGQAISALLRAYYLTNNNSYLQGAEKAFEFMKIPVADGGVLDTTSDLYARLGVEDCGDIFFQEYVTNPKSYTLNGFIFTMLGLYDLSQSPSIYAQEAGEYFSACNLTLRKLLKYYDLGQMTCYDLCYITNDSVSPTIYPSYHLIHINLMQTMYSITRDPLYRNYLEAWEVS